MLEGEGKSTAVKTQVLELIHKTASPLSHRLDCMLKFHYTEQYIYSEDELTLLIEYASATRILLDSLQKYISHAMELNMSSVSIPFEDFAIITHTSKVVEKGFRVCIGQTPLWTH